MSTLQRVLIWILTSVLIAFCSGVSGNPELQVGIERGIPQANAPGAAIGDRPESLETKEPPMTNLDLVKLTQAGLGSAVIVGKIEQAPAVAFDLSTAGLVALGDLGVPQEAILAVLERAARGRR